MCVCVGGGVCPVHFQRTALRKQPQAYIGPPSEHARYEVLRTAVQELGRAGIIGDLPASQPLPAYRDLPGTAAGGGARGGGSQQQQPQQQQGAPGDAMLTDGVASVAISENGGGPAAAAGGPGAAQALGRMLQAAAAEAEGFSGRALRKLPFLAHASGAALPVPCGCAEFLAALRAAAAKERADRSELTTG